LVTLHPGVKKNVIYRVEWLAARDLFSHKVFSKSFDRSQLPHKSVNLSFTITNVKNKLMDLYGN